MLVGHIEFMPCLPQPCPCSTWYRAQPARGLLAQLAPIDLRLAPTHGGPHPDGLAWLPAGVRGAAIFDALGGAREAAIGPAFASAANDVDRAAALAIAQCAPTVAAAVAARFGDPHRWRGYAPLDATRMFRANWVCTFR